MNEIFVTVEEITAKTTKEVENMVRKAETLKSLDELNVSARTRTYLKKNFDSIDDVIKHGRCLVYDFGSVGSSKWESELTSAVKEAGLIRPKTDFARSFRIGFLYASIFWDNREDFIWHIDQLSNEQYESFVGMSDEDIENVKVSLCDRLTEREYKVICRRFGLDGDEGCDLESVAQYFRVTRERVHQIEAKALRKLRHRNTLPALFDAPIELNAAIRDLISELDELHQDPIFKRECELLMKLERMKKLPLRYSDAAGGQLDLNELLDSTPIEKLDLSVRTYNCLKRAGIDVVSDILRYPKDAWCKVRNLGRHHLEEVIEKMHSVGYEDFSVNV